MLFGAAVRREVEEWLRDSVLDTCINVSIEVHTIQSIISGQYHLHFVGETVRPEAYLGHELVFAQLSGFPERLENNKEKLYRHLGRVCLCALINGLSTGNAVDETLQDMLAVYQSLADGLSSVTAPGNLELVRDHAEFHVPPSPPLMIEGFADHHGYDLDVKTLHRETAWWMAREMASVNFLDNGGRFGTHRLISSAMHIF